MLHVLCLGHFELGVNGVPLCVKNTFCKIVYEVILVLKKCVIYI